MVHSDTAKTALSLPASLELLSLPTIAIEDIFRSASFSGAIAACSCRALRDAWRRLTSSNPEFAATALVDRFQTVDAAAEHLYKPEPDVLGDRLVKSNIAAPAPGLLDAVASPLLFIRSALLDKCPSVPALGYLTATGASDEHALALLRHLSCLRIAAGREADPAAASQTNNDDGVENANEDGIVAGQEVEDDGPVANQAEAAASSSTPFLPRSVYTGAAFAGHEATVVELIRQGADPVLSLLPAAVRAGNARLCAALLEGGRMAGAARAWSAAAGGDTLGIRGAPSGFVDSYASSGEAILHMASIYWMLPLTYIDPPLGIGGRKSGVRGSGDGGGGGGGGSSSSSGSTVEGAGGASGVCAGRASAREPAVDVAAALAAARAAAEQAADTALGGSNPLPLFVQSSAAAAAAAAAAATAAALPALTLASASCDGMSNSSSSSSSSGSSSSGGGGCVHVPGQASLSSATNHVAVRQLLLQWRPSDGRAPPPNIRAAALPYAAAVGAWPVVSELLRAGVDPQDGAVPATLLYLALVQGRGAMAAWLLVRLLAHPAGVWKGIVGALFAALVTRIMGITSPLQQLLRYKPVSFFEKNLIAMGHVVVYPLCTTLIPFIFLPTHAFISWSLCKSLARREWQL